MAAEFDEYVWLDLQQQQQLLIALGECVAVAQHTVVQYLVHLVHVFIVPSTDMRI